MTKEQIEHMVNRFLGWRLPDNFSPDGGITFKRHFNEHTDYPMQHEPTGTNLFDATQAEEMIRYMLDKLPQNPKENTMPHDLYSNELKVGDSVLIPCKVKAIHLTEEYCNLDLETNIVMHPTNNRTSLTLNSRQVILQKGSLLSPDDPEPQKACDTPLSKRGARDGC